MTGPADGPLRLGAAGGRQGAARAPLSALLSAPRAIRDAIYGRLEEMRFRTGVTILAGCVVTAAALGGGAVLLGRSAPAARTPRAAAGQAAATPASPLASSYRPHTPRPRTPAPAGQPQQLAPAAAGNQAPSAPPAPAPAAAAPSPRSRCWPSAGGGPQDGGRTGWPCAGTWRRWHWHHAPGDPGKR